TNFYRAIIHRLHIGHLGVSGIGQSFEESFWEAVPQVPRDPHKARIGDANNLAYRSLCTRFQPIDMYRSGKNKNAKQIGYIVHAHCWLLVGRYIGIEIITENLKIFVKAVEQFWTQNIHLWMTAPYNKDIELVERSEDDGDVESSDDDYIPVRAWRNPAIVPEIQTIIEQATRVVHQSQPTTTMSWIPLDIAIQVVEITRLASATDTQNMLAAFGWRLPDSYWQSCCDMELIFEYGDLRKSNTAVDWQFLVLETEKLSEDDDWCKRSGLRTRRRIFQFLPQIRSIFLDMLEQDRKDPGSLSGSGARFSLRKPFI
ncbi:hypothetical protein BGW36DRAFT_444468, partial [Talaromyces proteolyticus]